MALPAATLIPVLTPALVDARDFALQAALGIVTKDGIHARAVLTLDPTVAKFFPWSRPAAAAAAPIDAPATSALGFSDGTEGERVVAVGPEPDKHESSCCELFVGRMHYGGCDMVTWGLMQATGRNIMAATPISHSRRPKDPPTSMIISVRKDDAREFLALDGRCMCTVHGLYVVDDSAALALAVAARDALIAEAIQRFPPRREGERRRRRPRGMQPLTVQNRTQSSKRPAATRPDDGDAVRTRPQQPSAEAPPGTSASSLDLSSRASSQE